MTEVVARIKVSGKNFETIVDLDRALDFKKGKGEVDSAITIDRIFYDVKKGLQVSDTDLTKAFKTTDTKEIISRIIKQGEVQLPVEYLKKEQEGKIKQVIDFLSRNVIDPKRNVPYTTERIKSAIDEAKINIENKPVEEQISQIIAKLQTVIPIKVETKKIKIKVPPAFTGRVYGLLKDYKEKEEWLNDGSMSCIINVPTGLQIQFYDKLNSITHGNAITEEIKE